MASEGAREQLRKMRVAAGCRFNAAERLRGRDRRSAILIAIASSIVLSVTIVPYVYHVSALVASGFTALSFFTSLLIIAFSLVQYSTNDAVNSEQFHRSGLEIYEICRRFEARIDEVTSADLIAFSDAYSAVLQKYSINNDSIDYDLYRVRHNRFYKVGLVERTLIHARRFLGAMGPYILLLLILAALVAITASDRIAGLVVPPPAVAGRGMR